MSEVLVFFVVGLCLIVGMKLIVHGLIECSGFLSLAWKRGGKTFSTIVMVLGLLLLPVLTFCMMMGHLFEGMCNDEMQNKIVSTGGTYTAYVFIRDCGAITSSRELVTHILLRESSRPLRFNEREIEDDTDWLGRANSAEVYVGDYSDLRWTSDNHLMVRFDAKTFTPGDTHWNGITISYVPERIKPGKKSSATMGVHPHLRYLAAEECQCGVGAQQ